MEKILNFLTQSYEDIKISYKDKYTVKHKKQNYCNFDLQPLFMFPVIFKWQTHEIEIFVIVYIMYEDVICGKNNPIKQRQVLYRSRVLYKIEHKLVFTQIRLIILGCYM